MEEWLRMAAFISSILTSMIAVAASIVYWVTRRSRRVRLESCLKAKKEKSSTEAFSIARLMADLSMTEAEILPQASQAATLSEASVETAPRALQPKCCFSIERRPRAHSLISSCTKKAFAATSTKAPSEPRSACRLRAQYPTLSPSVLICSYGTAPRLAKR